MVVLKEGDGNTPGGLSTPIADKRSTRPGRRPRVRIGICGPHRLIRSALAEALAGEPDLDVVAVKRTAENLAAAVGAVVLDAVVVVAGGASIDELAMQATHVFPSAAIVAVGRLSDRPLGRSRVRQLDGSTSSVTDVARILRQGEESDLRIGALTAAESRRGRSALTDREIQVLRLISQGMTSEQIGVRLKISTGTVGRHRQRIYAKLGVGSSAQAVTTAVGEGLLASQTSGMERLERP